MPLMIGITSGEVENKLFPWSPAVQGQSHTYVDAVIHNGGAPVMLPITNDLEVLKQIYEHLGGILFAGGNDIHPSLYSEDLTPQTKDPSLKRDKVELQLMQWAYQDQKPILAICRGMQLLNVFLGGTLYQDIPSALPEAKDHLNSNTKDMKHLSHTLKIDTDSRLYRIFESQTVITNSYHHQAINKLAPELKAVAWSEDGVIEGVEGRDEAFVIGVQSHPEAIESNSVPMWANLFSAFIDAVKEFDQSAVYSSQVSLETL